MFSIWPFSLCTAQVMPSMAGVLASNAIALACTAFSLARLVLNAHLKLPDDVRFDSSRQRTHLRVAMGQISKLSQFGSF
ncbi:hypothetical protein BCCGELA001_30995 [Bradyrhizobium sp. CCGE-LA001]|nr:hypothetical protein BCCGELA001_30995 [Bradyrhizobium sp. CCGE-LA001]